MSKNNKLNIKKDTGCFIVPLHIYPINIIISLYLSTPDFVINVSKLFPEIEITESDVRLMGDFKNTSGRCVMLADNNIIISIYSIKGDFHGTLAHEVFHAVSFIMERIGAKLEIGKSDESYAYLIGYISKQIYKKIRY